MNKHGRPRQFGGSLYQRPRKSKFWWARYRDQEGRIVKESTRSTDRGEAERFLRDRLDAKDDGTLAAILKGKSLGFNEWADWFLEKRSAPPFRIPKTHRENQKALRFLWPHFGSLGLQAIDASFIEAYLELRLATRKSVRTKFGVKYRNPLKPATVHQEFRVLRRILNLAVRHGKLIANPCQAVEFPVRVSSSTRKPHYMTASEQALIEFCAPEHLRNAVVILVETGLRPYKELMPIEKPQIDLENSVIHVVDSKTQSGIAEVPLSEPAREAIRRQILISPESDFLFPTPVESARAPHITSLKRSWESTLRRAGVPYFPLYHLRHTFATRLSAGGVSDHFVTQMLRQTDSQVFKRYSQAQLQMKREALEQMDRTANERILSVSGTPVPN